MGTSNSNLLAALTAAKAPRAILTSLDASGQLQHSPVEYGQSLIRLETELIDHLNAKPYDDQFLADLRDYCAGRLAARDAARATGGFVIPRSPGHWEIAHIAAFQPVEVAHD